MRTSPSTKLTKRYRKYWLLLVTTRILIEAPQVIIPFLNAMMIDRYLDVDNRELSIFIAIIAGLATAVVLSLATNYIESYFIEKMEAMLTISITKGIYHKAQKLKVKEYDKKNSGYFISRITSDAENVSRLKSMIPYTIFGIALTFFANLTFIFVFNWIVGLVALGASILSILIMSTQRRIFKRKFKIVHEQSDRYYSYMSNSINGVRAIKNFNIQDREFKKYKSIMEDFKAAWRSVHFTGAFVQSLFSLLSGIAMVSIILVGAWWINIGWLSIGGLTAITAYTTKVINPIASFMMSIEQLSRGKVSKTRVDDLLNEEEEDNSSSPLEYKNGEIEFKNVTLKYNKDITALNNISLTIQKGEHVALVGSTGSGKSTLLKALVRHYDINDGQILIDGQDISKHSVNSVRAGITYVSQEGYLSNDTVERNVTFTTDGVKDEEYARAMKWSDSTEFVKKLPEKDETVVGPEGIKLSGGQKQRITIARGLLKNSEIILFDESTSALDNKTEKVIQKNIEEWTKGKTTITIAHRLSTIKNSDRIIVMSNGEIVEMGTHDELVNQHGRYYNLLNSIKESQ